MPPDRILDEVAERGGEVDVFLCYAVLEHMDIDERLALLRMAKEVLSSSTPCAASQEGDAALCEAFARWSAV